MLFEYTLKTSKREELINIDNYAKEALEKSKIQNGIAIIFTPHTTSAITINENADPDVKKDIINFLNQTIPVSNKFKHFEGNSDSHIKSSLIGVSESLIIKNNLFILGTWQSIYFCEFDGPRNRKFYIKII